MDTYGDMVTLLLTFFVMLFAMSNVDAHKWNIFVNSIPTQQTQTEEVKEIVVNGEVGEEEQPIETQEAETVADVDTLYLTIAEKLNEIGVEGATVVRGKDYTYISFRDNTFFEPDSSELTEQGERVLNTLTKAITPAQRGIGEIDIMAHTAKANPKGDSDMRKDRMLSAMRAAEATIYIQDTSSIEPKKLVDISYGEFRPIADNSTEEGRAKNRRVEFILLDEDAKMMGLDQYYEDLSSGKYADSTVVTDGSGAAGKTPAQDGTAAGQSAAPAQDGAAAGQSAAPAQDEAAAGQSAAPAQDEAAAGQSAAPAQDGEAADQSPAQDGADDADEAPARNEDAGEEAERDGDEQPQDEDDD